MVSEDAVEANFDWSNEKAFEKEISNWEIKCRSLIAKAESKSSGQKEVLIDQLIPKDTIGRVVFFREFANYKTNRERINIDSYLFGDINNQPRYLRKRVQKLRSFFEKSEKSAKARKNIWRQIVTYTQLVQSIREAASLQGSSSQETWKDYVKRPIKNLYESIEGTKQFQRERERVIETQLMRQNMTDVLLSLGVSPAKLTPAGRRLLEKYQNYVKYISQIALFGGVIGGTYAISEMMQLNIPIFNIWLALGFIPARHSLRLSNQKVTAEEVLTTRRKFGLNAAVEKYNIHHRAHQYRHQAVRRINQVLTVTILYAALQFIIKYGDDTVAGLKTAYFLRDFFNFNQDDLKEAYNQTEDNLIRIDQIETVCRNFALDSNNEIYPQNSAKWQTYLKTVSYIRSNLIPRSISYICRNRDRPDLLNDQVFFESNVSESIDELNFRLIRTVTTEIFWLWIDSDIGIDYRLEQREKKPQSFDYCQHDAPVIFQNKILDKYLPDALGYEL